VKDNVRQRVIIADVDEPAQNLGKENPVAMQSKELKQNSVHEDFSEYVAHLQLHMTLQARNLVPTLKPKVIDSREQLLHQTQATVEKLISRQRIF